MMSVECDADVDEFIHRYNHWRAIYARTEKPAPDSPLVKNGRLVMTHGYPHEGWVGYVIECREGRWDVLSVTTERLVEPRESLEASFSSFNLAGRYIIWKIGGDVRVTCRVTSLRLLWEPQTLASGVRAVPLAKFETRYELVADPNTYMIVHAGGIQPENRLLVMNYDELDRALEDGLPASVIGHG